MTDEIKLAFATTPPIPVGMTTQHGGWMPWSKDREEALGPAGIGTRVCAIRRLFFIGPRPVPMTRLAYEGALDHFDINMKQTAIDFEEGAGAGRGAEELTNNLLLQTYVGMDLRNTSPLVRTALYDHSASRGLPVIAHPVSLGSPDAREYVDHYVEWQVDPDVWRTFTEILKEYLLSCIAQRVKCIVCPITPSYADGMTRHLDEMLDRVAEEQRLPATFCHAILAGLALYYTSHPSHPDFGLTIEMIPIDTGVTEIKLVGI